jgi:DNA-directed RNA polymerase I, II, and III subunit RPABC1
MSPPPLGLKPALFCLPMSVYAHIQRLFTMRETLKKMLTRRGYELPVAVQAEMVEQFTTHYLATLPADVSADADLTRLSFCATRRTDGSACMVFFPNDVIRASLGIAPIRTLLTVMQEAQCSCGILVVACSLTAPAVAMLRDLELKGMHLTAFNEGEVLIDIYEHAKVPLHVPLSASEKAALLSQLKITEKQLPEMQRQDPMARYLGLRVGDVVRIHRVLPTVGHDISYRVVVNSEDFS